MGKVQLLSPYFLKSGVLLMRNKKRVLLKRAIPLYFMLLIPLAWIAVFQYIPIGGNVIAFKNYNVFRGIWSSDWVGLAHFRSFLTDEYFWQVLKNTVRLGAYNLIFNFPAPIILALLINEVRSKKYKKLVQTVSYMPYFISMVALASIMIALLSPSVGIVNKIMASIGFEKINFYALPKYFPAIYILLIMWQSLGWGTIVYLAAMAGVDTQMYDAAAIDGAGRLRVMRSITLPSILPVISIMFILSTPGILDANFDVVLLLQLPTNFSVSDVVPSYVYRRGIGNQIFDYSTAVSLAFSVVKLVVILGVNRIATKLSGSGLW